MKHGFFTITQHAPAYPDVWIRISWKLRGVHFKRLSSTGSCSLSVNATERDLFKSIFYCIILKHWRLNVLLQKLHTFSLCKLDLHMKKEIKNENNCISVLLIRILFCDGIQESGESKTQPDTFSAPPVPTAHLNRHIISQWGLFTQMWSRRTAEFQISNRTEKNWDLSGVEHDMAVGVST